MTGLALHMLCSCGQMGCGRVESLQQDLREARLPDQGGAVYAGTPRRQQKGGAQQTLH